MIQKIFSEDPFTNYHVALTKVQSYIKENINLPTDQLFHNVKKVNAEFGGFFDLEDLQDFISYGKNKA